MIVESWHVELTNPDLTVPAVSNKNGQILHSMPLRNHKQNYMNKPPPERVSKGDVTFDMIEIQGPSSPLSKMCGVVVACKIKTKSEKVYFMHVVFP